MTTQHPETMFHQYDDLTRIKGIGPARQHWLRETFAIRHFADLAALSPAAIYERLKEEGLIGSLTEIESWTKQAEQLAAATPRLTHPHVREKGWQPFASFVVEFQVHEKTGEQQTTVHHMEADKTEKWPGVGQQALCQWMTIQLGDKVPKSPAVPASAEYSFSEKMQQMIEKSRGASSLAKSPSQSQALASPAAKPGTGFSEKMQSMIQRAQALPSRKK